MKNFADNEVKSEEYEKYLEKEQEKLKEQAEASKEKADDDDSSTQDIIEIATASPYAAYLNEKGEWDHSAYPTTTDVKNEIWRNGIISNSFEPGSTGKVLTYAAAIEEGLITEETQFDDSEGYLNIGRTNAITMRLAAVALLMQKMLLRSLATLPLWKSERFLDQSFLLNISSFIILVRRQE